MTCWSRATADSALPGDGLMHTHTHPFNAPMSGSTRVSRYQKGKTNLDFSEARYSEWQWYQLGHMQICTSLQTNNYASTPPLSFLTGRMLFLPPNQHCQSTEGIGGGGGLMHRCKKTLEMKTNKHVPKRDHLSM